VKTSERLCWKGFGKDVGDIVMGWNVGYDNVVVFGTLSDIMPFYIDVFRARMEGGIFGQDFGGLIVAKNRSRSSRR